MRLLWLPHVLRAAGLTVHETPGWQTRGDDNWGPVRGITAHHTGGARESTVAGEMRTLLHGSQTAPAPIAQLFLERAGVWHVVASGLCFHNLVGWGGPNRGHGNESLLGVEAQHSGGTEPWTELQYQSYVTGVAALVAHHASGWDVHVSRVAGHKEHQPGDKSDPTFNMTRFRGHVAAALAGKDDDVTPEDIEKVARRTAELVWSADRIARRDADGRPITTGNIRMAADYALSYGTSEAAQARAAIGLLRAEVAAALGRDTVDEQQIITGVLAGLTDDQVAQLPADLAEQVVAKLADRLAS